MTTLIPKFKTIGTVYSQYLEILGVILETAKERKTLENMKEEKDGEFDLENLKEIPVHYIDYLKKYDINNEITEKLKIIVKKYMELYKKIVLNVNLDNLSQENTDTLIEMFIFVHSMDETYEELSKVINLYTKPYRYYHKDNISEIYKDIFDKVLNIIDKKNYNDLNIEEDSEKISCYCNINKLKNSENMSRKNDIPKIETLKNIVDTISSYYEKIDKKTKQEILVSLFLARIYDYTKNKIIQSKEISDREQEIVDREETNISFIIDIFEQERKIEFSKIYPILNTRVSEKIIELLTACSIKSQKENEDHKKVEEMYKFLSKKTEQGFFARYKGVVEHSYANYLIMSGRAEKALDVYFNTLELIKYRYGENINSFLEKAISLCAYLRKKRELAKFYKYGVAIGAIEEKFKENENDDVILNHYEKEFCNYFPIENYYKNIDEKEYKKIYDKYTNYIHRIGYLPELDLKKPNKKIFYNERNRTQLMIFGSATSYSEKEEEKYQDYLKKLLKAGADPGVINSTNQTALMETIDANNLERALILLEAKGTEKSINTISLLKKVTPFTHLFDRIQLYINCSTEKRYELMFKVINKMFEKGIKIDLEGGTEKMSPLYQLIGIREKIYQHEIENVLNNKKTREMLKRERGINKCTIAEGDKELSLMKKPGDFCDSNGESYLNKIRISHKQQYELIDLFLKNGADVNKKMEELSNYTPFLYSIEVGDIEIFKKLYKAGGNVNDKIDKQTCNILGFAKFHNSYQIYDYMKEELKIK